MLCGSPWQADININFFLKLGWRRIERSAYGMEAASSKDSDLGFSPISFDGSTEYS